MNLTKFGNGNYYVRAILDYHDLFKAGTIYLIGAQGSTLQVYHSTGWVSFAHKYAEKFFIPYEFEVGDIVKGIGFEGSSEKTYTITKYDGTFVDIRRDSDNFYMTNSDKTWFYPVTGKIF